MTRHIFLANVAICSVILLFTTGCVAEPDNPAAAEASASDARSSDPAPPSEPLTEEEIIAWAERLEEEVHTGSDSYLSESIDMRAVLEKATAPPPDDPKFRSNFISSALQASRTEQGLGPALKRAVAGGGSYSFLHVLSVDGQKQPIFRFLDPSGALNYHCFMLRKQGERVQAVDLYVFAAGELLSQTLRRYYLPTVVNANRGFLARLTQDESAYVKHIDDFMKFTQQLQQRQYAEVLRIYDRLPEVLQRDKTMMVGRITAAQFVDDQIYAEAMEDFKKHHPNDPAMRLMLIDSYVLRKDYPGALDAIDALDQMVGGDPHLHILRANMYLAQEAPATARDHLRRATEEAPELIDAQWTLLGLALKQEDHAETLRLLRVLRDDYEVEFDDLSPLPEYTKFIESPQYQQWLESQNSQ